MTQQIVDGMDGFQRVLREVEEAHNRADFQPTLETAADDLKDIHAGYFATGAGPSGSAWPDWYWRRKGAWNEHPTLVDTKRLQSSLTTDGGEHIENVAARSLEWGTSVPYSALHNYGGEVRTTRGLVGRRGGYLAPGTLLHIPQREHVGMNAGHVDKIINQVADREVELLKA